MGSLALSRVEAADQPAPSIVDEVARIARQELAPIALAIDAGSVYPGELLRRLGERLGFYAVEGIPLDEWELNQTK